MVEVYGLADIVDPVRLRRIFEIKPTLRSPMPDRILTAIDDAGFVVLQIGRIGEGWMQISSRCSKRHFGCALSVWLRLLEARGLVEFVDPLIIVELPVALSLSELPTRPQHSISRFH